MKLINLNVSMRAFFLFLAAVIWLGIWLTGFGVVHWVSYVPAVVLVVAAITGICPGMHFMKAIFGGKKEG